MSTSAGLLGFVGFLQALARLSERRPTRLKSSGLKWARPTRTDTTQRLQDSYLIQLAFGETFITLTLVGVDSQDEGNPESPLARYVFVHYHYYRNLEPKTEI